MTEPTTPQDTKHDDLIRRLIDVLPTYGDGEREWEQAEAVLRALPDIQRIATPQDTGPLVRKIKSDGIPRGISDCCSECQDAAWEECFLRGQCRHYRAPQDTGDAERVWTITPYECPNCGDRDSNGPLALRPSDEEPLGYCAKCSTRYPAPEPIEVVPRSATHKQIESLTRQRNEAKDELLNVIDQVPRLEAHLAELRETVERAKAETQDMEDPHRYHMLCVKLAAIFGEALTEQESE